MAGGYRNQPEGIQALVAKFRGQQAQIDSLRKAIAGLGITVDGATGDLVFSPSTGALLVRDSDGQIVAEIGNLAGLDRSDGSKQPGVRFSREDGSTAVVLADVNPLVAPFRQAWQVYDRAGHVVMADDTNSGAGLAVPWVPLTTPINTNTSTWPATTATVYTAIAESFIRRQNPGMFWSVSVQADAATTGQFQLVIDGTVIATSPTVSGGFASWTGTYYWPPSWIFDSAADLVIQAKRTAGTGTVRAMTYEVTGIQS